MPFRLRLMKRILSLLLLFVSLIGCNRSDPIVVLQLHPKNPDIIYIATNDYIYKTRDAGQTWTNLSKGMSHSRVISMAIDPIFERMKRYDGDTAAGPQHVDCIADRRFKHIQFAIDSNAQRLKRPRRTVDTPVPIRGRNGLLDDRRQLLRRHQRFLFTRANNRTRNTPGESLLAILKNEIR